MLTEPISPDTVMYLVNAVCFEAKWEKVYEEEPALREFHAANGTAQTAKMMYSEENTYLSDEHAAGFMKNYQGGKYAFAAILPEEGMTPEQYLADLQPEALHTMLANAEQERSGEKGRLPEYAAADTQSPERLYRDARILGAGKDVKACNCTVTVV